MKKLFQVFKVSAGGNKKPLRRISAASLQDAERKISPHHRGKVVIEPVSKTWVSDHQ